MLSNDLIDDLRKVGEVLIIKGNKSIYLDDPRFVWFIVHGEMNVFAVPYKGKEVSGKREFLFSIKQNELVVGIDNEKNVPLRVLMNGMTETEVIQIEVESFRQLATEKQELQTLIQVWGTKLSDWLDNQTINSDTKEDERNEYTAEHFFKAVFTILDHSNKLEAKRLKRLATIDQEKLKKSMQNLISTMKTRETNYEKAMDSEGNLLVRTCKIIGENTGISIKTPKLQQSTDQKLEVKQIAKTSNVRIRQVSLSGNWWKNDQGALLCFMKDNHRPVALIPKKLNRYELHDLTNDTVQYMTQEIDQQLDRTAFMFYRPLPIKKLSLLDLVKYSLQTNNIIKDIIILFVLGIAGGLLGLAIPVGLGQLVDTIIPAADRSKIFDFVLILVAIAIAIFGFELTRSLAMLRIEGRLDAHMQAAVWDRVLNLPVPFFRNFTAGDLAMRASSVSAIRQALSGTTLSTIFTGIFSFTQFFILFYYSPILGLIATGLIVIVIGFTLLFGLKMVQNQRRLAELNGRLAGLVFQLINGIAKFRVSGSERRAFGLWSDNFSAMRKVSFKTGLIENNFQVFNAIYPLIATIVLFYSVWSFLPDMSTGAFLAFNAAFSGFLSSMIGMTFSFISVLNIIPIYERAKPILEALPEIDEEKEEIVELKGDIEVNQVDFAYEEDGPLILKNVSLRVRPGEFVAIVGTSGSGKSTLMRLLLGFEEPASGSIYYDHQDLDGLDIQSVRSKLGVVLQGGQLLSGDIYTNIVGSSNLTIDDAWEAARMAGLEEDIKNMPMGMFTVVDEGARTLSGGQRQRLLIARALVHKPSIIFFDEATSALDNRTQKIVSDSIESLQATRIVIAHRLSTIINADRIYVMDNGSIVEEGTFDELMDKSGMFSELAKRQMA